MTKFSDNLADEPLEKPRSTIGVSAEIVVPHQIKPSLQLVTKRLTEFKPEDFGSKELFEPAVHLLRAGGRKIRAALLLSSAVTLGLDPERFINLGMAVELQHTASLVVDDVVDNDRERRGIPAVHVAYGLPSAFVASHAIIAKGIKYASQYGTKVVEAAAQAGMDMSEGEMLDYLMQKKARTPSLDEYRSIIELKTASLMAVAVAAPAIYAGDDTRAKALREIGLNMGRAFQARDDIMESLGLKERPPTDDERARAYRPNLVSVFAELKKQNPARPEPLQAAIKLSNFYVGQARECLPSVENPELFEGYLQFLEIKM